MVLVGGTVSFVAAPTPPYGVTDIFTTGVQVAPAAGTVLADTGPLPIGAYSIQFVVEAEETADHTIQWRDALNVASLREIRIRINVQKSTFIWTSRFNIENDNERFRVINVGAGGVGTGYQSVILASF